jgi:wyosine [tRNA(Phe)-imidazoG37] synthetase (radical SAM superfamily)
MNSHIIFGANYNVRINFNRLVYVNRLNPVCFVERNKDIIGRHYFGLPVLSFKDAVSAFPQAKIYIANDFHKIKAATQQYLLLNNVSENDIVNFENFEYCKGCLWTRTFFTIYSQNILPCTEEGFFDYSVKCSYPVDYSKTIFSYFDFIGKLRQDMSDGKKIPDCCFNCCYYKKGLHRKEIKIRQIGYGIGHECNSNCIYCSRNISECGERLSNTVKKWQDKFDFSRFLLEFKKTKYYDAKLTQVFLGPGEISVHKDKDKILKTSIMDESQFIIATNCILFAKDIATLAAKPQNYLFTSLDSGTAETFKNIKRVDKFNQTVDNIKHYKESGSNIYLKYIILPQNISNADLEGFVNIVKSVNPIGVDITKDAFMPSASITEKMTLFADGLAKCLDSIGIPYLRYL